MTEKKQSTLLLILLCFLTTVFLLNVVVHADTDTLALKIKQLTKIGNLSSSEIEYNEATQLSEAFKKAGGLYNIEPELLAVMAYFETVYRTNLKGDSGKSHGILQVGKQGRRACECNMDTLQGQVDCGACWLDTGRTWCGSLEGGLCAYINGDCKCTTLKSKRAYQRRIKLLERFKND